MVGTWSAVFCDWNGLIPSSAGFATNVASSTASTSKHCGRGNVATSRSNQLLERYLSFDLPTSLCVGKCVLWCGHSALASGAL